MADLNDDWDGQTEDEEAQKPVIPVLIREAQFADEDEDDDIKDNWDDEDEEEEENVKPPAAAAAPSTAASKPSKNKKKVQITEQEDAPRKPMTAAEAYQEKMRVQKLQEDYEMGILKETFGNNIKASESSIDSMVPATKEDFERFQKALSEKITEHEKSPFYPGFTEELVRNICVPLNSATLKKIKMTVEAMSQEKAKTEKNAVKKQQTKGKSKTRLHMEVDDDYTVNADTTTYDDDFDDFM